MTPEELCDVAYWWLVEGLGAEGREQIDGRLTESDEDDWQADAELDEFRKAMTM